MLEEAQNERHPLLERLRFLSISASNLDEFYMVRVAGIYGQVQAGVQTLIAGRPDARAAAARHQPLRRRPRRRQAGLLARPARRRWRTPASTSSSPKDLRATERSWLQRLFMTHMFPILTPIAVDPAHPFPFILNRGLAIAVEMQRDSDGKAMNGLIPIPGQLERFIRARRRRRPIIPPSCASSGSRR